MSSVWWTGGRPKVPNAFNGLQYRWKSAPNASFLDVFDHFGHQMVELQASFARSGARWRFDHVFGPTASTWQVYEATAQPIVEAFCTGQSGCVVVCGPRQAGKRFTMQARRSQSPLSLRKIWFNMIWILWIDMVLDDMGLNVLSFVIISLSTLYY